MAAGHIHLQGLPTFLAPPRILRVVHCIETRERGRTDWYSTTSIWLISIRITYTHQTMTERANLDRLSKCVAKLVSTPYHRELSATIDPNGDDTFDGSSGRSQFWWGFPWSWLSYLSVLHHGQHYPSTRFRDYAIKYTASHSKSPYKLTRILFGMIL